MLASALLAPAAAVAHHSPAAFDTGTEVEISGEIVEYSFRNPHVYLTLAVTGADGRVTEVEVEAGAGSVIRPLGFTPDAVAIGDTVRITGNPAHSNPGRSILGKELYKHDGSYYPLNIRSRSNYQTGDASATSIAGTWFSERDSFFAFLENANDWPLTPRGSSAMAATDPLATPQKDCIPLAPPALMFYPVVNTIGIENDRVTLDVDWMDSRRIVYLDGRSHPDPGTTFPHGHSIGRWDGDALVIDTRNFSEHPMGLSMNLPGSTGKHLTERLELNEDGTAITYSGTIVDDEYLSEPVRWSGHWVYRPDMERANEQCDLDVARRFLD